eukprot:COSAG04_NODE_2701_length_3710_cov_27.658820_4_plen_250_part_00
MAEILYSSGEEAPQGCCWREAAADPSAELSTEQPQRLAVAVCGGCVPAREDPLLFDDPAVPPAGAAAGRRQLRLRLRLRLPCQRRAARSARARAGAVGVGKGVGLARTERGGLPDSARRTVSASDSGDLLGGLGGGGAVYGIPSSATGRSASLGLRGPPNSTAATPCGAAAGPDGIMSTSIEGRRRSETCGGRGELRLPAANPPNARVRCRLPDRLCSGCLEFDADAPLRQAGKRPGKRRETAGQPSER